MCGPCRRGQMARQVDRSRGQQADSYVRAMLELLSRAHQDPDISTRRPTTPGRVSHARCDAVRAGPPPVPPAG
jgi:hypothetical protein